MSTEMTTAVSTLKAVKEKLQSELTSVEAALRALNGNASAAEVKTIVQKSDKPKRTRRTKSEIHKIREAVSSELREDANATAKSVHDALTEKGMTKDTASDYQLIQRHVGELRPSE